MAIRIITAGDVERLLPMDRAIELVREGFAALSAGAAAMPPRSRVAAADGDMLVMPAYMPGRALALKAVLTYPGNRERGLPAVRGLLLAFDHATGSPLALVDAESLTALRTGAAGGAAADLFALPGARSLTLVGCGIQGKAQLQAVLAVRNIERAWLVDTDRAAAEALATLLEDLPCDVAVADRADDVVPESAIVVTATTSPVPVFDGRGVRPGTHVTAVGGYRPETRELDEYLVTTARVFVDQRDAAAREAGELIQAGREPDAEIGAVINETADGRQDERQVTVFKTVGVAVQDAAVADWIVRQAEKTGAGTVVDV